MISVSSLADFGHQDHGWLKAVHHFSFADYFDPDRMGFGPLRVWNDDQIKAGTGFPQHPHQDMEIVTYIRKGAVSHEDNLGNQGRTAAGQVQVMSAGTGIRHSEYNLEDEDLTLFQIWVHPDQRGHAPRWDQRDFDRHHASHGFETLVSGRGGQEHEGALFIHADAEFKAAILEDGEEAQVTLEEGRLAYVVPARGALEINGVHVPERGSAAISAETKLTIKAIGETEVVLFDLPS